jgi:hypothetical protein
MSKRWLIALALFLTGIAALLLWITSTPPEPVYEGRTLSSWLDHHVPSSAARPPYNSPGYRKAEEALRTIGTNGIPTLLKMIGAKDLPPPLLKLVRISQRYRWSYIHYRSRMEQHEEADYAFEKLGTNGASAVPELIRIYERNVSPSSQRCAARALGSIGRPAQAAVPVLLRDFTHTNKDVRFYAVTAVSNIGGVPDVVIPAMTAALKDSNLNVRWNALNGLQHFGSRSRVAVPELKKMLNDPGMLGTHSITQYVEVTLWRIAPEKVGRPLVIESNTPIITNGVTSEAVKFLFYGKRQALVRSGSPVPAVRQHWSSDPRPRLTIFRGGTNSNENDRFLGHFEVMDVPTNANVNISTLCIVADGHIILNARDNTRERFLEIRRIEKEE